MKSLHYKKMHDTISKKSKVILIKKTFFLNFVVASCSLHETDKCSSFNFF